MQLPSFVDYNSRWPHIEIFEEKKNILFSKHSFTISANIAPVTHLLIPDISWIQNFFDEYVQELNFISEESPDLSGDIAGIISTCNNIQQEYILAYKPTLDKIVFTTGMFANSTLFINDRLKVIENKRINDGLVSLKNIFSHVLGINELPVNEIVF